MTCGFLDTMTKIQKVIPKAHTTNKVRLLSLLLYGTIPITLLMGFPHSQAAEPFIGPLPQETPPPPPKPVISKEEMRAQIDALKAEQISAATTLITEYPTQDQPLVIMGKVYRQYGDDDKALELWEKALAINSQRADILRFMADVAFEREEYEKAVATWRRALLVKSPLSGVHTLIGKALRELGRHDEALQAFQADRSLMPRNMDVLYFIGETHLQQKEYQQAETWFDKIMDIDPFYLMANQGLAEACRHTNNLEKAEKHDRRFKRLDAKYKERDAQTVPNPTADLDQAKDGLANMYLAIAAFYRKNGQDQKAEASLKRLLKHLPDHILCHRELVKLYRDTQRTEMAFDFCSRLTELDVKDPYAFETLAKLSLQLKRYDKAEPALTQLLFLRPKSIYGLREMARLLIVTRKKYLVAKILATQAVEIEPSAENYFVLGLAHGVNRERDQALKAFKQASELDPKNAKYRRIYQDFKSRK